MAEEPRKRRARLGSCWQHVGTVIGTSNERQVQLPSIKSVENGQDRGKNGALRPLANRLGQRYTVRFSDKRAWRRRYPFAVCSDERCECQRLKSVWKFTSKAVCRALGFGTRQVACPMDIRSADSSVICQMAEFTWWWRESPPKPEECWLKSEKLCQRTSTTLSKIRRA